MGRKRKAAERVLGPYRNRGGWFICLVAPSGERTSKHFTTKKKAEEVKQSIETQIITEEHTTETAQEAYDDHLRREGNKKTSRDRTMWAINVLFPAPVPLWSLTERKCEQSYEKARTRPSQKTGEPLSVDSHRGALAETKTFLDWCVERKWIRKNPLTHVKGKGRRSKRKPQLRIRNIRTWYDKAMELATKGDLGAIAALMTLLLGMRAGEIVSRRVEHVDEDELPADILWIPDEDAKTHGIALEVPSDLRPFIVALTKGKESSAPLFPTKRSKSGVHDRGWPLDQVKRICVLAKVPPVTAHSMRGALATLTLDRGVATHIVSQTFRHRDTKTTTGSYAEAGTVKKAERRKGWKLLEGGKGK